MVHSLNLLKTQAMIATAYRLVSDLFPESILGFDNLQRAIDRSNCFGRLRDIVNEQTKSSLPEDKIFKNYSVPNVQEAIWNTFNVLFNLLDKLRKTNRQIEIEDLRILLESCVIDANTPIWLRTRIIEQLPAIVIQEFGDRKLVKHRCGALGFDANCAVFENSSIAKWKTEEEIEEIQKANEDLPTNIYVDDISGAIYFREFAGDKIFRQPIQAGHTSIYFTLILLLIKVGFEWEYTMLGPTLEYLWNVNNKTFDKPYEFDTSLFGNINSNICRIKKRLASVIGKDMTNNFIDSSSRHIVYIRPYRISGIKTIMVMKKDKYDKIIAAMEFGERISFGR
ncbi:MAG: hypothetical protein R3F48_00095 [Candidatus Zixiibacteriota bacterium]